MRKIGEIAVVILLLSLGRLAITIPNLQPIGAAALFGGALLGSRWIKFLIPFAALFIGDLILSLMRDGYAAHLFSPSFYTIYLAFGITVLIGSRMIGKEGKMKNVIGSALLSSVVFFLLTNFGSWLGSGMYEMTFAGLMKAYWAGLAFFRTELFGSFFFNTVMGNVFFSAVAFGLYSFYTRQRTALVTNS